MAVIAVFKVRAKEDPECLQTKYNDAIQENEYEYNIKDYRSLNSSKVKEVKAI